MKSSFILQQDQIVVSAIEIISESGLSGLSLRNLAIKGNLQEAVVYKYFGGINEVLIAVVESFVKFDKDIMSTVKAKESSAVAKIQDFFEAYATYYGNYKEISSIILNYEELLHNTGTREMISQCIVERNEFLKQLIQEGIENNELSKIFSAEELADLLINEMNGLLLSRRVMVHDMSLKQELLIVVNKILSLIQAKNK